MLSATRAQVTGDIGSVHCDSECNWTQSSEMEEVSLESTTLLPVPTSPPSLADLLTVTWAAVKDGQRQAYRELLLTSVCPS